MCCTMYASFQRCRVLLDWVDGEESLILVELLAMQNAFVAQFVSALNTCLRNLSIYLFIYLQK